MREISFEQTAFVAGGEDGSCGPGGCGVGSDAAGCIGDANGSTACISADGVLSVSTEGHAFNVAQVGNAMTLSGEGMTISCGVVAITGTIGCSVVGNVSAAGASGSTYGVTGTSGASAAATGAGTARSSRLGSPTYVRYLR